MRSVRSPLNHRSFEQDSRSRKILGRSIITIIAISCWCAITIRVRPKHSEPHIYAKDIGYYGSRRNIKALLSAKAHYHPPLWTSTVKLDAFQPYLTVDPFHSSHWTKLFRSFQKIRYSKWVQSKKVLETIEQSA